MKNIIFQMPKKVEIGFSKSNEIAFLIKEMGLKRVLIVIDCTIKKIGIADHIFISLRNKKISYEIFDAIKNEPTIFEIDEAINNLKVPLNFDIIVGIGGGSTLDFAKILAVSNSIKGSIKSYIGTNLINAPGIPTIMLPTTSGTGSEATPNAIVKDSEKKYKRGIVSSYLIPDLVILDPELTLSLPAKVTAETGIDAFTHAIECFIGKKSNTMSDLFALSSIRLISKNLLQAVKDGSNKEARYNMTLASFYGGVAITNSGTGGVHALAYPLGGKYGMSHGLSNSILLADVMEFNIEEVPEKFVKIAEVMGIKSDGFSEKQIAKEALNKIKEMISNSGVNLSRYKFSHKDLEYLARSAVEETRLLNNNPRPITYLDALRIYKKSLNV
jgi:alcohol dehydrogenase class IV